MTEGALTLYTFQHVTENNIGFHEGVDKDLFRPDGIDIAYIISNFQQEYHPDWLHCKRPDPPPRTSNRGRKKKEKKEKIHKTNNGDNTQFSCAIILGVIMESVAYNMKIFRKNSGNISSVKHEDQLLVSRIIDKAVCFMNSRKNMGMTVTQIRLGLKNKRARYHLQPGYVVNLYLLTKKLKENPYINIDGKLVRYYPLFNNTEAYAIVTLFIESPMYNFMYEKKDDNFSIKPIDDNQTRNVNYQVKYHADGKIYVYGGKEDYINDIIIKFMFGFYAQFVQKGYAKMTKLSLANETCNYNSRLSYFPIIIPEQNISN